MEHLPDRKLQEFAICVEAAKEIISAQCEFILQQFYQKFKKIPKVGIIGQGLVGARLYKMAQDNYFQWGDSNLENIMISTRMNNQNQKLTAQCDFLIIAVQQHQLESVFQDISPTLDKRKENPIFSYTEDQNEYNKLVIILICSGITDKFSKRLSNNYPYLLRTKVNERKLSFRVSKLKDHGQATAGKKQEKEILKNVEKAVELLSTEALQHWNHEKVQKYLSMVFQHLAISINFHNSTMYLIINILHSFFFLLLLYILCYAIILIQSFNILLFKTIIKHKNKEIKSKNKSEQAY